MKHEILHLRDYIAFIERCLRATFLHNPAMHGHICVPGALRGASVHQRLQGHAHHMDRCAVQMESCAQKEPARKAGYS